MKTKMVFNSDGALNVKKWRTFEPTLQKAQELLLQLGFKNKLVGTSYLAFAITLCYFHCAVKVIFSTQIYPVISARFKSSVSCVEKAIHNSIKAFCQSGALRQVSKTFGYCFFDERYVPTNVEFVCCIASRLRLNGIACVDGR